MARHSDGEAELDSGHGGSDGPRKKQRLEAPRPMCTNCEQCQLRKGKCDGGRPICGWCAANNKACVYQEKKKPGLKAGYGRDLEKRLTSLEESLTGREAELEEKVQLLEERLEAHSRMLEHLQQQRIGASNHDTPPTSATIPRSGVNTVDQVLSPHASHHSNGSMMAHSPAPLSAAAFSATPAAVVHDIKGYRTHLNKWPSYTPPAHTPQSSQNISGHNNHPTTAATTTTPNLLPFHDMKSPPFDLSFDLLELYFERINPWFPLLDRKSTMNRILRSRGQDRDDEILLYAIIATTIRFYDKTTQVVFIPEYWKNRTQLHDHAKQQVLLRCFEKPSIRGLQALVILALDMVGSQNGGPGMFLLAAIARCATQLGLTSETFSLSTTPDYPSISTLRASVLAEPKDFIEDETRRRLFWLIYVLDRDSTVATAFDFVLDDSTIDRKLPCKDELFAANDPVETRWFSTIRRTDYSIDCPRNLGTFSYLIELKGLLTNIHQFLKRPVNINAQSDVEQWRRTYREIDCNLRSWRSNLPFELRNTDQILTLGDGGQPMSCGWILLQMTYYTVFIRMHSSAAYPPYRTPIFTPSYSASQQCYQAVDKIVALAKYVLDHNMLAQQGPPFAFSLWVGARVLLVHGSTVEKHVSANIHVLIHTLVHLGRHWPVAARYAEILQHVMAEYQDSQGNAAAAAMSGSIAPQPPSVAILADMRRCAYDLDTLISNEPLRQPADGGNGAGPGGFAGGLQQQQQQQQSGYGPPAGAIAANAMGSKGDGTPMLTEMDYLETFNFFNYPRMPNAMMPTEGAGFNAYYSVPSDAASQASLNGYGVPDGNSDWLSTHFT